MQEQWEREQEERRTALESLYSASKQSIGEAHNLARLVAARDQHAMSEAQIAEGTTRAKARSATALQGLYGDRAAKREAARQRERTLEKARVAEKERAAKVYKMRCCDAFCMKTCCLYLPLGISLFLSISTDHIYTNLEPLSPSSRYVLAVMHAQIAAAPPRSSSLAGGPDELMAPVLAASALRYANTHFHRAHVRN
jgi:hypothetical protein